jgi:hypothetical protein
VNSGELAPGELLLQVLGVLESEPESETLTPLRDFVKGCAQAADCRTSLELVAWSCTRRVTSAALSVWNPSKLKGLSLAPQASQWLDRLACMGSEHQGGTLSQLSGLSNELAATIGKIETSCPRPERDCLLAVMESWQQTVQAELEQMMGGGFSS